MDDIVFIARLLLSSARAAQYNPLTLTFSGMWGKKGNKQGTDVFLLLPEEPSSRFPVDCKQASRSRDLSVVSLLYLTL